MDDAQLPVSLAELQLLDHPIADTLVVIASWALPFAGAALFLHGWLFKDYELRRPWVQFLFSATFATSLNLLILALYEILGVMDTAARWLTWRVVLVALSVDLVRSHRDARAWVWSLTVTAVSRMQCRCSHACALLCTAAGATRCAAVPAPPRACRSSCFRSHSRTCSPRTAAFTLGLLGSLV